MKTHFLAVATHEIRTPLSVIIGYNQFLLKEKAGKIQSSQKKILEESVQSCERLLSIVNEMLDFSRIETGNLELHLKETDLSLLLGRVYRQMKIISDRANINFQLQLPDASMLFFFDPDRIEQVLVNLISNSIKYTPEGGAITLSALKGSQGKESFLEVSVSDTGRGLSPAMLKKIFKEGQPFVSNPKMTSPRKGVGLGLAISRRIIDAHRGRIGAKSEEGQGATFTFRLPIRNRRKEGYSQTSSEGEPR